MSPSAKTSGWPGRVRSGLDRDPPRAVDLERPPRSASFAASPEAVTPAAQTRCGRATRSTAPRGSRRDRVAVDVDDGVAERAASRRAARGGAALRESPSGKPGRTRSRGLDEQHAARAGVDRSGSRARSVSCASSAICPAISTPVGRAPTTTKVSQALASLGSGSTSAASNAPRMRLRMSSAPASDFSSGAYVPPFLVPEVGVVRAAGDDQRVVAERRRPAAVWQVVEQHLAPLEVEARHLGLHDAGVPLPPQDTRRGVAISAGESAPVATW